MTETWIENLSDELVSNNTISSDYYSKFDVKRGLRNQDGSGVLAGLTHVSSVVGSEKTDIGLSPIHGILKYRGTSLSSIIDSCPENERFHFERICFFLLVGRMPNSEEVTFVCDFMAEHRVLPNELLDNVIKGIPSKNIMNKLQTSVAALYAFDENPDALDATPRYAKPSCQRICSQEGFLCHENRLERYFFLSVFFAGFFFWTPRATPKASRSSSILPR